MYKHYSRNIQARRLFLSVIQYLSLITFIFYSCRAIYYLILHHRWFKNFLIQENIRGPGKAVNPGALEWFHLSDRANSLGLRVLTEHLASLEELTMNDTGIVCNAPVHSWRAAINTDIVAWIWRNCF